MQKKLYILLAITLITINLAACSKTEKQEVVTLPPEVLQEAPPAITPETPSLDTQPIVESDIITEPEAPTETETPGESVEIIPSDKPAAEGEFGTSADFSGVYEICGYSAMSFGSQRSLSLDLEGVDNENSGTYEASHTTIPNYVTDFKDYIYMKLTFSSEGLTSWSFIDKLSMVDLGQMSESDLNARLFPETQYEQVAAGTLPEEILLSHYTPGKMYVFDLPENEDGSYVIPPITNDTDIPVLAVSVRVGENEEFSREMKVNKVIESNSMNFSFGSGYAKKIYMAVMESSVDYVVRTADCYMLSNCTIGSAIDFDFEDFVYNDTNETLVLNCDDETYILNPGDIVECSWMNDIVVESAT